ncbi:MAG: DUF599 domain-containing protein [Euryarchaeota archaeon]|nr:DUF599 domain-containing protein [Euryarchaeota archaeon]
MISLLDFSALAIFFICTIGYHSIYYPYRLSRAPMSTAKGKINLYRRSWVEEIVEKRDVLTAVQQVRNLTMVATMFTSSSLLILGVIANIFMTKYSPGRDIFSIKVYLLMTIFGASFLLFLFSLRHLNYFSILIGAKKEVVESTEKDMVEMLSERLNLAMNRYTLGARCFYYSLAAMAWFFSTWAFVAITLLITAMVIVTRDFK